MVANMRGDWTHSQQQAHTPEVLGFLSNWRSELWKLHLSLEISKWRKTKCIHLLENFDFRLCLCGTVGIISPTVDECLQMLAILHLRLVLTPQVSVAFGFC